MREEVEVGEGWGCVERAGAWGLRRGRGGNE